MRGAIRPKQRARHLIDSLIVDEESIAQLAKLPPLHRDTFDRLLISQALQHELVIVKETGFLNSTA